MARRRKGRPVSGWINLDKPLAMTSTGAVGKIRWLFQAQKAGHAGTLDPLATGVLPIALGEATKTVPYMMNAPKAYRFTVKWGAATETDDTEGAVIAESAHRPSDADIRALLPAFTGTVTQTPPVYSAIKVQGERAYDLARQGTPPVLAPRRVQIDAFKLMERLDENSASFEVACGKGTYVRALARDLAIKLGTYAHITGLRRTRVGGFEEKTTIGLDILEDLRHIAADAAPPDAELDAGLTAPFTAPFAAMDRHLLPLQTALDDIPALPVSEIDAKNIRLGRAVSVQMNKLPAGYDRQILTEYAGTAVALGDVENGIFKPARVFNLSGADAGPDAEKE
jgi:tRNA pseudouridine55 synthase